MQRPAGVVIHEDRPGMGIGIIVAGISFFLILVGAYSWWRGDVVSARGQAGAGLIVALIMFLIWPRKYQVLPDALQIVFGAVHLRIPFENIHCVEVSSRLFFGIGLGTSLSLRHVEITRKRGQPISITPRDQERFVAAFEHARRQWLCTSRSTPS